MRAERIRTTATLTMGLVWGVVAAGSLRAQEPGREGSEGERCVCVDVDEIRERALAAVGRRARLGVAIEPADEAGGDVGGVRVTRVFGDGPAAEAGLEEGDVIVAVDGRSLSEPLDDPEEEDDLDETRSPPVQRLVAILRDHEPGDQVSVTYLREGERRTATVELGGLHGFGFRGWDGGPGAGFRFRAPHPPSPPGTHMRRMGPRGMGPRGELAPLRWIDACRELAGAGSALPDRSCVAGLRVETLKPGLGEYFGTDEGVLVIDVAEGSTLGVRPGDVIIAVGERSVEEAADLQRILASYREGEEVRLRLRRQGRELTVTGALP